MNRHLAWAILAWATPSVSRCGHARLLRRRIKVYSRLFAVRSIRAGVAQLVERNLAKVEVASSRLVSRSIRCAVFLNAPHRWIRQPDVLLTGSPGIIGAAFFNDGFPSSPLPSSALPPCASMPASPSMPRTLPAQSLGPLQGNPGPAHRCGDFFARPADRPAQVLKTVYNCCLWWTRPLSKKRLVLKKRLVGSDPRFIKRSAPRE